MGNEKKRGQIFIDPKRLTFTCVKCDKYLIFSRQEQTADVTKKAYASGWRFEKASWHCPKCATGK